MATSKISIDLQIQFRMAIANDVGQWDICNKLGITTDEFRREFAMLLLKKWEPAQTWSPTCDIVPFGILPKDIKEVLCEGGDKIPHNRLLKFRKDGALIEFADAGFEDDYTMDDDIFCSVWSYIQSARVRSLSNI